MGVGRRTKSRKRRLCEKSWVKSLVRYRVFILYRTHSML